MSNPTVRTEFSVDITGLRRGIEQAKTAVKGYKDEVVEQSRKARAGIDSMRESIDATKAAFAALGAVAVTQTAQAVAQMARLADQARSIDAYFSDSFGVYTEGMRDWADRLAEAYGLAESSVESFSARLNSAFLGAGQSARDAAEMSKNLTQLSYDLSVKLPYMELEELQEMINDLAVGGGESALEKILPGLDEESLKAKAKELGIMGDELTVATKQAAAYALLMEEYADDLGAYAEEGDSATVAMNRMNESVRHLSESLGTLMGPVVASVADAIGDFAEQVGDAIDALNRFLNINTGDDNPAYDFGVIEDAMAGLREEAEETSRTLQGLAGFDRLNILNTGSTTGGADKVGTDWEDVLLNFSNAYDKESDRATDAMEEMWEHLVEESKIAGNDMTEVMKEYFGFMTETMGETTMREFYESLERAMREGLDKGKFAELLDEYVRQYQNALKTNSEGEPYDPDEQPHKMVNKNNMYHGVEQFMAEVGKFADWVTSFRIPGFASGGVFQPNTPMVGILGDNTREVEVAAPYSTIVRAVRDAMGSGGSSTQTLNVTLQLDGRTLSREVYKMMQNENRRRF